MTPEEYAAYERAFAEGSKDLKFLSSGGVHSCEDCNPEGDGDLETFEVEGWFSWGACDVCGSNLGGNRYPGHYVDPEDGEVCHLEMCTDCVYYLEYGRLDDMTMDEIDAARPAAEAGQ